MGGSSASYEMDVPFPAGKPILEIVDRLAKRGWTPLKEDSVNAGIPTSMVRSWTSFIDATKSTRVRRYSWVSEWKDAKGNRAYYSFRYESPEESQKPLRRLIVYGYVVPKELQDQLDRFMASDAVRRMPGPISEGPGRTVLDAGTGWAFLASGPGGEAVFRVDATPGNQVAYRWRFRTPDGTETHGSVPVAATMQTGPFRLFWEPHSPVASRKDGAGIGYAADEMDLIPVPGEQFESIDLGEVHALANLLPDRNARYARPVPRPEGANHDRLVSLMDAGSAVRLGPGQAVLVRGAAGSGVIEILEPELRSVKYRWRFRRAGTSSDESGSEEASESPFPNLRVGPYSLQWELHSVSKERDAKGTHLTGWLADVKYLPEELSAESIPSERAASLDLGSAAAPVRKP